MPTAPESRSVRSLPQLEAEHSRIADVHSGTTAKAVASAARTGVGPSPSCHPLDVLLRATWPCTVEEFPGTSELTEALVVSVAGRDPRTWLRAGEWRVFARPAAEPVPGGAEIIETFTDSSGGLLHAWIDPDDGNVHVPFSLAEAFESYVSEAWCTASGQRRLSERQLNVFYGVKRVLPRRLQLAARRALVRRQGQARFPAWPLDTSVSRLLSFFTRCRLRAAQLEGGELLWFWPGSYHAAIVLTHDVEGPEGIRLAIELADLEEEHGFRSSFNFGAWYEIDPGVLRDLRARGFEIGTHGLTHDRALFASRDAFDERLPKLAELAQRLGAVGFRSPATHRVFDWLAELPVSYDCTIPNSDPYEPQPGGCCSVLPFFVGPVVELPYTLPQDHTLLTLLRHRTPSLWLAQAAAIEREHGLIQCLSHPDPGYLGDCEKRALYAEFLTGMAARKNVWRALPREVAAWWRHRAAGDASYSEISRGFVRLDDGPRGVAFEPPPSAPSPRTSTWRS